MMPTLRRRLWRRRWRAVVGMLILALALLPPCHEAGAHAFLERSSPEANAILPEAPAEVRMRFTEPLEPAYTSAQLYDSDGTLVQTEASRIGSDQHELILPLPDDLPRGTYTVQWRNVSAADGHPQAGYIPFTVGGQADVVVPELPELERPGALAGVLGTAGRWLGLLGVTVAVGAITTWLWVVRGSLDAVPSGWRALAARRSRLLALSGVGTALVGSGLLLGSQVMTAAGSFSLGATADLLGGTRFGYVWLVRLIALSTLGALLARPLLWAERPPARLIALTLAFASLSLLTFSLLSHAAAQPAGRPTAITVDWLHLAGSSVWVGGLITLLLGLIQTRGLTADQRRAVYAEVIPRFSTVALASVVILGLTGIYSAWLQVGNLHGLRETDYGRALTIKLLLVLPMLVMGALNLRVIGPAMLRKARARVYFARAVLVEATLGVAVLLVVGVLISMPPARETLIAESGRSSFHFSEGDIHASLYVTPGATGLNYYTADISPRSGELPEATQVLLRVSHAGQVEGLREVELRRQEGSAGRFEARGSELSVVGQWNLELIVRQPGTVDWRVETPITIGRTPPEARVPGPPPRFEGITPVFAVLAGAAGVVLVVAGLRRRAAPAPGDKPDKPEKPDKPDKPDKQGEQDEQDERRFVIEAGIGLLLIALVTLPLSRAEDVAAVQGNPIPMTAQSVETGRALFLAHCAVCHGESGYGDGPLAASLNPPPDDLRADHVDDHTDAELHWWLRYGIAGTAMPGFADQLTDEELWHLVNYVRSIRHPLDPATAPDGDSQPAPPPTP